jgi:hypothetical protein
LTGKITTTGASRGGCAAAKVQPPCSSRSQHYQRLRIESPEETLLHNSVLAKLYPNRFTEKYDEPTKKLVEHCCYAMRMLGQKMRVNDRGDTAEARAAILWHHCMAANPDLCTSSNLRVSWEQLAKCAHVKLKQLKNLDQKVEHYVENRWLVTGTSTTTRGRGRESATSQKESPETRVLSLMSTLAIKLSATSSDNLALSGFISNLDATTLTQQTRQILRMLQTHYTSSGVKGKQPAARHQTEFTTSFHYYALAAMFTSLRAQMCTQTSRSRKKDTTGGMTAKQKQQSDELKGLLVEQAQQMARSHDPINPFKFRNDTFQQILSYVELAFVGIQMFQKEEAELKAKGENTDELRKRYHASNPLVPHKRARSSGGTSEEANSHTSHQASIAIKEMLSNNAHLEQEDPKEMGKEVNDSVEYNLLEERWGAKRIKADRAHAAFDKWRHTVIAKAISTVACSEDEAVSEERRSEFLDQASDQALISLGII